MKKSILTLSVALALVALELGRPSSAYPTAEIVNSSISVPVDVNSTVAGDCRLDLFSCARPPLRVPGDFRTIQGAIDAAVDGDTILLDAGIYNGSFLVEGKRLRIIGSDEGRTEIRSSSREVGLATYANGGGGELKDISFVGGAYAVRGVRDGGSLPSALALKNVSIADGYRGIYGAFSSLGIKAVAVAGTQWHGISITHLAAALATVDLEVSGAGGVGLHVFNFGPGDMAIEGHFHDNAGAGISIHGSNGVVKLSPVQVDHNGVFGVELVGASAEMAVGSVHHNGSFGIILLNGSAFVMGLSAVANQFQYTGTGCSGAALGAADYSVAHIQSSFFVDNCVGFSGDDTSLIAFGNSTFNSTTGLKQPFFSVPNLFDDLGGNVCGFNLFTPAAVVVPCSDWAIPAALSPPEPVGGSE